MNYHYDDEYEDFPELYDNGKEYELTFKYDKEFIEKLKESIPSNGRSYDPKEKVWTISHEFENELVELLTDYYGDYWS